MSRVKRNLSAARMEQLMRERGLFTSDSPEGGIMKTKEIPDIVKQSWKKKPVEIGPEPDKASCPCEDAGLLTGRHKVDGGHCVDGVFWTDVEINGMRHIKLMMGDAPEQRKQAFLEKIALLKKHLDLDIEQGTIGPCS
jgi:hypothetical protein